MKIIKPGFEILKCPDGEEALAFIELIGRKCYKSEELIDTGLERCACLLDNAYHCASCNNTGYVRVRPPSSHRFVRDIIMKQGKTAKLKKKVTDFVDAMFVHGTPPNTREDLIEFGHEIVEMAQASYKGDPEHASVIEHVSFTVCFTFDRGISHELVRHRLAAITQSSTRYCNYSKGKFGSEIAVIAPFFWPEYPDADDPDPGVTSILYQRWHGAMQRAEATYMELMNLGAKPQEARSVLPNSLQTEVVFTANLREWLHVFNMRGSKHAHPQMREAILPLITEIKKRIPIIFDEI